MLLRLTENVFLQDGDVPPQLRVGWSALRGNPAADPRVLSQVIHFFRGREIDQRTQELTAQSVVEAKRCGTPSVQLLSVVMAEEQDLAFAGFSAAAPLTRSIADVGKFAIPRRLPLLFDIIDAGAVCSDPNAFMILTNSDICLNAGFYNNVSALLRHGVDCLVINRMTVGEIDSYQELPELGGMEVGQKHPGFDCFVFPVSWISSFAKVNCCVGMRAVMRPLLYNLVARANRMLIMRHACLTHHYGDEMSWAVEKYKDYTDHNRLMMAESLKILCRDRVAGRRLSAFCARHGEPFVPQMPA